MKQVHELQKENACIKARQDVLPTEKDFMRFSTEIRKELAENIHKLGIHLIAIVTLAFSLISITIHLITRGGGG